MRRYRLGRSVIYFSSLIVVHSSLTTEGLIFTILAIVLSVIFVIIKLAIRSGTLGGDLREQVKLAIKFTQMILLSINYLNTYECLLLRSIQYLLLGSEIQSLRHSLRVSRFNSRTNQVLIVCSAIISFNLGQIRSYQQYIQINIELLLVHLIWIYELGIAVTTQNNETNIQSYDSGNVEQIINNDLQMEDEKPGLSQIESPQKNSPLRQYNFKSANHLLFKRQKSSIISRADVEIIKLKSETEGFQNINEPQKEPPVKGQIGSFNDLIEIQKNFYLLLFDQFPDGMNIFTNLGMIIMNEKGIPIYCNQTMKKLFGAVNKREASQQLLGLKNCWKKFEQQAQFQNLFKIFKNKLSNHTELGKPIVQDECIPIEEDEESSEFQDLESDSEDINIQYSDKKFLKEEFDHAILRLQGQIGLNYQNMNSGSIYASIIGRDDPGAKDNPFQQSPSSLRGERIRFIYEVKMLCYENDYILDEAIKEDVGERQSSTNSQAKSQLFEVTLKGYIYENKPHVLVLVKDVTLFNQYTVLEQTNSNKSKMLYQVAHEFRTPLSCIILLSESLMDKYSNDQEVCNEQIFRFINRYFNPILTSASQLLSLVNDLLDLAQLKAGKFKLNNQDFDLLQILLTICQMLAPSVHSKGLQLKLVFDKKLPPQIKSDPNRIRQVVINLVSNAIKFTSKGSITIDVKSTERSIISISVIDTGVGIEKDDLPKIFSAFGKLEGTHHMNQQGVGLGLMISHILAQKLCASPFNQRQKGLNVTSKGQGHGCEFTFEIFNHREEAEQKIFHQVIQHSGLEVSMSKQQVDCKPVESNFSILCIDHVSEYQKTHRSGSFNKRLKTKKCGVLSSQNIQVENKIVYTFQIKQEIDNLNTQVPNSPRLSQSKKNSIAVLHNFKYQKYLQLNLGQNEHQLIKISLKSAIKNFPAVIGEPVDDFSPKDLGTRKSFHIPSQSKFNFKNCECPEILIVDDQIFNINVLQLSLKKYRLKIDWATSCNDTIQKLNGYLVSKCCKWTKIILMDIEMEGADGIETTKKIRELEKTVKNLNFNFQPAFIIGLSGHGLLMKQKCIEAGMDDFQMKPLIIKDFLNLLEQKKISLDTKQNT